MTKKKSTKIRRFRGVFAGFLMFIAMLSNLGQMMLSGQAYAVPVTEINETLLAVEPTPIPVDNESGDASDSNTTEVEFVNETTSEDAQTTENMEQSADNATQNTESDGENASEQDEDGVEASTVDLCKKNMGSLGWIVCPVMSKVSDAIDWLYEKIESILIISPIKAEEGSPVYEIWKYCLGIANIAFIIFLLIVIYSQLTGWGINNYGIKKALPKLIVMAILVNMSFLICSLAVDVSNIIGNGLRGVFMSVEETAMSNMGAQGVSTSSAVSMAEVYTSMSTGTALAIGAGALVILFEPGVIWMLIPVVLGAIVAVVTGLITISLRQAVVILLVMIAPLAFAANILPNTEHLFQKWKQLLIRMLVFYPLFSLLFGASSLAGFAIIMSAQDGFGVLLGLAVQIFPLFFSWKLMQMSGTFLGSINAKLRAIAAKPVAASRSMAAQQRYVARQKQLAKARPILPSTRLVQFMANRKYAKAEEMSEMEETIKLRGQAYAAQRNYKRNGTPSKEGERAYGRQADNMNYKRTVEWHKNNMNKGLGQLEVVKARASTAQQVRLNQLDIANVTASDSLKMEMSRGAKIDYVNTAGYYRRIKNALYANADNKAVQDGNLRHQMHGNVLSDGMSLQKYNTMKGIMEGKDLDTGFIAADAAQAFAAQSQIVKGKFGTHFDHIEATQDIVNEMDKMTKNSEAAKYIDPIIAGLKTLNMRGDTDLARKQLDNVLANGKMEIGSQALQSLSSYCMFDVKGSDPALRRFGKYINLETAKMFNEEDPSKRRTRKDITLYEYINGEYIDRYENGNVKYDDSGKPVIKTTKKSAKVLLKGTSFKDMERTAIANLDEMIRNASVDLTIDANGNEVGKFNFTKFKDNQKAIWNAVMPNVIGDHFSFLSGSEQIMAMGKGLTGVDVKDHVFDWNGIFGKEIAASLTKQEKKEYIELINARTKTFLGSQVPAQIARTKSDMLESIRIQYALMDAMEKNPELLDKILDPNYKMSNDEYKEFEKQHFEGLKKSFVESFKPDALKGFVKMHHKGYQGEAKDGLIQLLEPDKLYKEYFPFGERNDRRKGKHDIDDDEEDGAPMGFDEGLGGGSDGAIYNDTRREIDSVFENFRGVRRLDVDKFWSEAKSILMDSNEIPDKDIIIQDLDDRMSQYTDAAALYTDIMNQVFGGFSHS